MVPLLEVKSISKKGNWPYILSAALILASISGFRLFGLDRDYYKDATAECPEGHVVLSNYGRF